MTVHTPSEEARIKEMYAAEGADVAIFQSDSSSTPWWKKPVGIIILTISTVLLIGLGIEYARAHDALPTMIQPQGWTYPLDCCSSYDCREVTYGPEGLVQENGGGYSIATTKEYISQSDVRIKSSKDGQFHWCSRNGSNYGRTICLFVPPRAF